MREIVAQESFSVSGEPRTVVVMTPDIDEWDYGTEYYITISDSVTDSAGIAFAGWAKGDYSFTTEAEPEVELNVDGVQITRSWATANNEWLDGWEWVIDLTVPEDEPLVELRFSDFTGTGTTIAADNIRYFSEQTTIDGTEDNFIYITEAEAYPGTAMAVRDDIDPDTAGNQIQVVVQVRVPEGSSGSYSAQFQAKSDPEPEE